MLSRLWNFTSRLRRRLTNMFHNLTQLTSIRPPHYLVVITKAKTSSKQQESNPVTTQQHNRFSKQKYRMYLLFARTCKKTKNKKKNPNSSSIPFCRKSHITDLNNSFSTGFYIKTSSWVKQRGTGLVFLPRWGCGMRIKPTTSQSHSDAQTVLRPPLLFQCSPW